jgi:N-terminal domain of reverse transcriptase
VTQENQGKKTAGVDGIKSVKPKERLLMAQQVHPKHWKRCKPKPVRRVWIPKPGKDEKRPLGIPTMYERARQCLAKLALEPEWESKFEANSSLQWHLFEGRGGEAHNEAQKVSSTKRVLEAKKQPVLNIQWSPKWSDRGDAVENGCESGDAPTRTCERWTDIHEKP